MKNFQYITAQEDKDHSIIVYAADEQQTYKIKVVGFKAHFYIHENKPELEDSDILEYESGYVHEEGFPLKKVVVSSAGVIHSKEGRGKSLRDEFKQHFQADVPFIRNFLICTGIKSGFVIEGNKYDIVHYTDLIPTEFSVPLKVCYIDFEENVTTRFVDPKKPHNEVTAWTAYFTQTNEYYTGVLDLSVTETTTEKKENHILVRTNDEAKLLTLFDQLLKHFQPHLITYWHGKVADQEYPEARAKKLGVEIDYSPYDKLDLCEYYERTFKRLYYRLKDVAVDEGIYDPSELVAEEFHKDMWKENINLFIAYNKLDVEIMVKLDLLGWEKKDFISGETKYEPGREMCFDAWNLKNFVGLEDSRATLYNSVAVDTLMLVEAKNRNVVLHSSFQKDDSKHYQGADIFSPKPGKYENLQIIDMSRFYPNIIIGYNIDDLACAVVEKLNKLRDEYEAKMKAYSIESPEYKLNKKRRDTVKFILNSTYGYLGSTRSRKYEMSKAEKITAKARLGLSVIKKAVECPTPEDLEKLNKYTGLNLLEGIKVVYGHTDSLMLLDPNNIIDKIVWYLNEIILKEHCKNEGIPPLLKLKHEKSASVGIFVAEKGKSKNEESAGAHYALHITWKDGKNCDDIDIVGFEAIRGNNSPLVRKLQKSTISGVLRENQSFLPEIRTMVKDIRNGKYTFEKIATPINIKRPLSSYIKTQPFHVKAAIWSNENLGLEIVGGDRIKLLPVKRVVGKPFTKLIAFFDEENLKNLTFIPDYDAVEKQLRSKLEQFLELDHLSWRDVEGHVDPSEWF